MLLLTVILESIDDTGSNLLLLLLLLYMKHIIIPHDFGLSSRGSIQWKLLNVIIHTSLIIQRCHSW